MYCENLHILQTPLHSSAYLSGWATLMKALSGPASSLAEVSTEAVGRCSGLHLGESFASAQEGHMDTSGVVGSERGGYTGKAGASVGGTVSPEIAVGWASVPDCEDFAFTAVANENWQWKRR